MIDYEVEFEDGTTAVFQALDVDDAWRYVAETYVAYGAEVHALYELEDEFEDEWQDGDGYY